ncbi:TlpA family protein disulfide reductase [Candidatus Bathyarchaeota archaeon]|nr:TlpA family protein disulfide reductase [Candidatus Bathyarchaeota archaeon]
MKHRTAPFLLLVTISFASGLPSTTALEKAPSFTLTDTEGRPVALSAYSGRYLLIDFFATWCSPCTLQIERLKSLQSQVGSNLSIISIGIDPLSDTNQDLIEYKKKHGINWTVALDTDYVGVKYRVTAIPTLTLIDPQGNLVRTWVGLTEESAITLELPFRKASQTPGGGALRQQRPGYVTPTTAAVVVFAVTALTLSIVLLRRRGGSHEGQK